VRFPSFFLKNRVYSIDQKFRSGTLAENMPVAMLDFFERRGRKRLSFREEVQESARKCKVV
jgi:hypothetical protein